MYLDEFEDREEYGKIRSAAERFYMTYNRIMGYTPIESADLYEDGYYEYHVTGRRYRNTINEIDDLVRYYSQYFTAQSSSFQYLIFLFQSLDRFQDKYDSYVEGKNTSSREALMDIDQKYRIEVKEPMENFEKAFNDLFVPINENFKFAYVGEEYHKNLREEYLSDY